jgi:hypothetical protein
VTIQLPDMSGIQMPQSSLIAKWSAIQMGSKNPLFEWSQHKHATLCPEKRGCSNPLFKWFGYSDVC